MLKQESVLTKDLIKNQLREILKTQRQTLSVQDQKKSSQAVFKIFLDSHYWQKNQNKIQTIAVYQAIQNELSLEPFIKFFWESNKKIYLPILNPDPKIKVLKFSRYLPNTIFQNNIFGIPEPVSQEFLAPENLDLVLTPLLCFDSQGHRLGMGGGYYDATFSQKSPKTDLIGCAYEFQEINQLPVEPWDIQLQGIVTEHFFIESYRLCQK